jgi:hypothetical protein
MKSFTDEITILRDAGFQYLTYSDLVEPFNVGDTLTTDRGEDEVTAVIVADNGVDTLTVVSVDGEFVADETIFDENNGEASFVSITELDLAASPVFVEDYKNISLTLVGSHDADFTVKIQGSASDECPDFSEVPSVDNLWGYVSAIDLQNGVSEDGDDGFVFIEDGVIRVQVEASGLKWLSVEVIDLSGGVVDVYAKLFDNR